MVRYFDYAVMLGVLVWIWFAMVAPALFNMDSDVTLWMVFLSIFLMIFVPARLIMKYINKAIKEHEAQQHKGDL